MENMKPRDWWDHHFKTHSGEALLKKAKEVFPFITVNDAGAARSNYIKMINHLIDNEECLSLARADWLYMGGILFFNTEDQAIMFKMIAHD